MLKQMLSNLKINSFDFYKKKSLLTIKWNFPAPSVDLSRPCDLTGCNAGHQANSAHWQILFIFEYLLASFQFALSQVTYLSLSLPYSLRRHLS